MDAKADLYLHYETRCFPIRLDAWIFMGGCMPYIVRIVFPKSDDCMSLCFGSYLKLASEKQENTDYSRHTSKAQTNPVLLEPTESRAERGLGLALSNI